MRKPCRQTNGDHHQLNFDINKHALAMIQLQEEQQQASSSHQGPLVQYGGNFPQTPQDQLIPHQEGPQELPPHQDSAVDNMGVQP
jgi:hypothetical protein